ncbi:MAG TPA: helix-turn-helix domain-containing protein [Propionibacteriaceae bacterium]|nr:helix-turn-helix domain-containing protein [Propionibacteriaceae bacterium]
MDPGPESSENLVGELIRRQRELAELSMRQVAAMAGISNPYLSQIEHGLRAPSEAVLETIAATLGVPPKTLRPGTDEDHNWENDHDHDQERPAEHASFVAAVSADPGLTARQRRALTEIYGAMTEATANRRSRRSR